MAAGSGIGELAGGSSNSFAQRRSLEGDGLQAVRYQCKAIAALAAEGSAVRLSAFPNF
jgi:hypothetical protein